MPRRSKRRSKATKGGSNSGTLIPLLTEFEITDCGISNINGIYKHKRLEYDYYFKILTIQNKSNKNEKDELKSNETINDKNNCTNNDTNNKKSVEIKSKPKPKLKLTTIIYEIDFHSYLKNSNEKPVEFKNLSNSGMWILSRTDIYPKKYLYGVNCPFKHKIPIRGWIKLEHGIHPPPIIKYKHPMQTVLSDINLSNEYKSTTNNNYKNTNETKVDNNDNNQNNNNESEWKFVYGKKFKYSSKKYRYQKDFARHNITLQKPKNNISFKNLKLKTYFTKKKNNKLMIICGGQTGVDRSALDIAIKYNINYSGYIPKGKLDENGLIDNKYLNNLVECDYIENNARTEMNVFDSDATLILNIGKYMNGTLYTKKCISKYNRDFMSIQLNNNVKTLPCNNIGQQWLVNNNNNNSNNNSESKQDENELLFIDGRTLRVAEWIRSNNIKVLNIGGPRESERPNIYKLSYQFLEAVFCHFKNGIIPKQCLFQV